MPIFRATVDLNFLAGSKRGTNTWTLRTVSENPTTGNIEALMGFVKNFYDALDALFPIGSTFTWDGTVAELGTSTPRLMETATGWQHAGTNTNSYAPAPVMVCVTWKTALAAKSGRGRTFLGPMSPGTFDTADGTITSGNLTAIRAAANALVSASNDANAIGALCVWSELQQQARDFVAASVSDQAAVLTSRR